MNPEENSLEAMFTMESERTGIVEEPPFHILVLGDWSGDAETKPLADRKPVEIDRDNFDQIIARLGTRLQLEFDGSTLSLNFNELDDFHPDAIFRQVPLFSDLRELRKRLKDDSTFYLAAREVRERFGTKDMAADEPVRSSPPAAENLLDAILMQPSGGAAAPKPGVSSDLSQLVGELVRPHLVSVDENEQANMLAAVDAASGDLMRGILHHRRFRELEAAWRGLHFLVRRTETSTDLKIFLLDISKDELLGDLKSAGSLSETLAYKYLVHESIETPGGDPWAVVLGNYAFEPSIDDVAGLIRVSKIAAGANAPFIAHMRPDVLGVHSLHEHPDPKEWQISEESNAAKLWEALCDQTDSVYLGMTIPRFLARLPYGTETDPTETISFEEFKDGPVHEEYVWANACFAAGQLLAESYSTYGWEMGRALKQDIEGLPVHVYKDGTESVYKPCSEVLLSQSACERMMDHGLMPLVSYKNSDKVKLARFQSIADTSLKGMWS
jgi:type VI secretion system protein ImpC